MQKKEGYLGKHPDIVDPMPALIPSRRARRVASCERARVMMASLHAPSSFARSRRTIKIARPIIGARPISGRPTIRLASETRAAAIDGSERGSIANPRSGYTPPRRRRRDLDGRQRNDAADEPGASTGSDRPLVLAHLCTSVMPPVMAVPIDRVSHIGDIFDLRRGR